MSQKKSKLQTKNGFPILVEKKPKEKKQMVKPKEHHVPSKLQIDSLKVYESIGQGISNYKLDRIEQAEKEIKKSKHIHVYDDDRNSSMYIAHACQMEQAKRDGRIKIPNETKLFDQTKSNKITTTGKKYTRDREDKKVVMPQYAVIKKIEENSVEDLIRVVKAKKDFDDLFGPLKKVKVQQFREQVSKVFPDYDVAKVGSKIIATLKNYAYLKSLKGSDRKFIPDGDEIALIINASYIYDIAKFREQEPHTVLKILHAGALRTLRKVTNSEVIKQIEQIEDLLNAIEHQSLDIGVMDEFQHYDIKIKFLRLLNEPKLDSLIENILRDFDSKLKIRFIDGKSDYEVGMFYINMIKKLGLRYISSRSNIEWLFYGSTLKKIRNFMSKDMYRAFVKVIAQNLEAYKQKEYNGESFLNDSNLWCIEKSLKVIDKLREKKFKNKRV